MTGPVHGSRFENGVQKYADYLESVEGRLRLDLAFTNLQEFLPEAKPSLLILDVGCGTGALAARLARLAHNVTLLDSSIEMLDFAERALRDAGLAGNVALKHGEAAQLTHLFPDTLFDLVLCHNILEYVDDPADVLRRAACLLRHPGILSVLVRNRAGEVLKAALKDGDVAAAENNLTADWGHESLYGGSVRLFAPESLHAMLASASLTVIAERGVRVISDYLPSSVQRNDDYKRIFELERKLGRQPEFAALARYTHCLAHRAGPVKSAA